MQKPEGRMAKKVTKTNSTTTDPLEAPRKAHGIDADIKASNLRRLRRIEGQVRGIAAMIEDDRYCADISDQITAIQSALEAVRREVLRNHLKHCVVRAMRGSEQESRAIQEELLNLISKTAR
jgi:DNA-binding FrmR family transcriptional regulator